MDEKELKERVELANKTMKDFFTIQKDFYKEVLKDYFRPLLVVFAFFGVFYEMFKQMFISLVMSEEDYEKYQQVKASEEVDSMLAAELKKKEDVS